MIGIMNYADHAVLGGRLIMKGASRFSMWALFLLSFSLLAVPKTNAEPAKLATLPGLTPYSTYKDGKLVVVWSFSEWSDGLLGFNVYRREQGADEAGWRKANAKPVKPDMTLAHVDELGLETFVARIHDGTLRERPYARLVQYYQALGVREMIEGAWNLSDWAQGLGFAFADNGVQIGGKYEYRIVPVYEGSGEGDALCTLSGEARATLPICPMRNILVERVDERTASVQWEVDAAVAERLNLNGFKVYRGTLSEPLEVVGRGYVLPTRESRDQPILKYEFIDMVPINNARRFDYTYAVRPAFGAGLLEGDFSERVRLVRSLPNIQSPVLVESKMEDGKVRIRWTYEAGQVFKGFHIERQVEKEAAPPLLAVAGSEKTRLTQEPLPADLREYVDESPPTRPGTKFSYCVWAVSGDYRMDIPSVEHIPCQVPFPPPAAPKGLKVERLLENDRAFLQLTWEAVEAAHPVEYLVDEMWEDRPAWRCVGVFKDAACKLDVENATPGQGRYYRVRSRYAAASGVLAKVSAPSEKVFVRTFRGSPPNPVAMGAISAHDDLIWVRWHYPVSPAIAGFRLYADGKLIADEHILGPLVREYPIRGYSASEELSVQVTAIDDEGRESPKSQPQVAEPLPVGAPASPPSVDYDKAEIKTEVVYHNRAKGLKFMEYHYVQARDGRKIFHGDLRSFHPDGNADALLRYEKGQLHGVQRYYTINGENGKLSLVLIFAEGRQTTREAFEAAYGKLALTPEEAFLLKNEDDSL